MRYAEMKQRTIRVPLCFFWFIVPCSLAVSAEKGASSTGIQNPTASSKQKTANIEENLSPGKDEQTDNQQGPTNAAQVPEKAGSQDRTGPLVQTQTETEEQGSTSAKAEAWVEMDSDNPKVGDEIEYHVKITSPQDYSFRVPDELSLGSGFYVKKEEIVLRKTARNDALVFELVIPAVLLRVGRVVISGRTFELTSPTGEIVQAEVGKIVIQTGSFFDSEAKVEPGELYPPLPVKKRNLLLVWILIVVGCVALAVGATLFVMRRRRHERPVPVEPPRPAEEIALEKLRRLEKSTILEEGKVEIFYTRLSEILREYLGGRWHFDSLDMTTTELVEHLRNEQIEPLTFDRLAILLSDLDLVKFAKLRPHHERAHQDLQKVIAFVERTSVNVEGKKEAEHKT